MTAHQQDSYDVVVLGGGAAINGGPVVEETRTAVDAHRADASSGTVLLPRALTADAR